MRLQRATLAAAVATALVALAAGCGSGREKTVPAVREAALVSPYSSLRSFFDAARAGDAEGMWRTFSTRTRRRLGPTLDAFRVGAAPVLERTLSSFADDYELLLSEPVSTEFAVAALSGQRTVQGVLRNGAFAAALRFERGRWRVLVGGPVKITPTRPIPGERVLTRTKLGADFAAHVAVRQAGLWFDGLLFGPSSARTDPRHLGMVGEAPQPLAEGVHRVVAFASAGHEAAARAWAFTVTR